MGGGGSQIGPLVKGGWLRAKPADWGIVLLSTAVPGSLRRLGDCVERSSRSREPQFKTEEFLRYAASLKRQLAVKQSLRHGLRPCHLPLTREAKRLRTP